MTLFTTFLLASHDPIDHVKRHYLFNLGPFEVTNQMAMAVVAAVLMAITFLWLFNKPNLHEPPSGLRNFFESILEFLRVEVIRPALKEHTDRFVPFLWTLFFFHPLFQFPGVIPPGGFLRLLWRRGRSGICGNPGRQPHPPPGPAPGPFSAPSP